MLHQNWRDICNGMCCHEQQYTNLLLKIMTFGELFFVFVFEYANSTADRKEVQIVV